MKDSRDLIYERLVKLFGRTVRSRIISQLLKDGPRSLNQFNFDGKPFGLDDRPYHVKNSPSTIHRQLKDLEEYDFVRKEKSGNLVLWTLNKNDPLIESLIKYMKKSIHRPENTSEAEYNSIIVDFFVEIGIGNGFTSADLKEYLSGHHKNPSSARLSQLIKNYIDKNNVKKIKRGHFFLTQMPEK